MRQLLPYAEKKQVHLVMENHYKDGPWIYPEFAQKSTVYLEIIDQICSPWFGVNYDPSNVIFAGEEPLVLLEKVKNGSKRCMQVTAT
ncbi:sugar phosphate isomerase/epimerase family protein [Bacillus sp. N9]